MKENKKILGIISVVVIFLLIITNAILFSMYVNKGNIGEGAVYEDTSPQDSYNTASYVITYMEAKQCPNLHYVPNRNTDGEEMVLNCGYEDCSGSQCKYVTYNLLK